LTLDLTGRAGQLAAALADRYRLEREIGAGGMATVYLAEDARHRRRVAIKVLHSELSAVLGTERFLKEIELTASLQHPHILPLFDSGAVDGQLFYVMPLVEGQSLRDRLTRETQLPVGDAVRIATEVASALDYAHRRGVVHRDIKPENILLHDGAALVADFGIALAVQQAGGQRMTQTGLSLGTPQYMAPEQAMGEKVIDHRADVYALGAVTYEMLAGEPPFTGPSAQAIVARVITEAPRSLRGLRPAVPEHVSAAVLTALEKLPADRFASAATFAEALRTPGATGPVAATPDMLVARPARTREIVLGTLAVALAGLAAWGWLTAARTGDNRRAPLTYAAAAIGADDVSLVALVDRFAVAPDGSAIVVVSADSAGQLGLFRRRPHELEPTRILGTPSDVIAPVFSPDGQWIAYGSGDAIMKVPVQGGTPVQVTRDPLLEPINITWGSDGRLRFVSGANKGLLTVPAGGGSPDTTRFGADTTVYRGEALPGGRLLLSLVVRDTAFRLAVRDAAGVTRELLAGFDGKLAPTGYVLFSRREGDGWALKAVPFDPRAAALAGDPVTLQRGVPLNYATPASATSAGDLVFLRGRPRTDRRIVLLDRRGTERELTPTPRPWMGSLSVSPDGTRIAGQLWDGARRTIWTVSVETGAVTPVTRDGDAFEPTWTSDGRRLAFTHFPLGEQRSTSMWHAPADGGPATAYARHQDAYPRALSVDGRLLLFMVWSSSARGDLWALPLDSTPPRARQLLATPADEDRPLPSPDGRWLAYATDASGRAEALVGAFSNPAAAVQVSRAGGFPLRWSRDGRRLFYMNGGDIWEVTVGPDGPLLTSATRAFRLPSGFTGTPAVLPDGESAVAIRGGRIYSDVIVAEGVLRP
jgi:serine/threonine-protein kinase